jgi:hypothetical protein
MVQLGLAVPSALMGPALDLFHTTLRGPPGRAPSEHLKMLGCIDERGVFDLL